MKSAVLFIVFLICGVALNAQITEYRITNEGSYEYLSDRQEAGMIFDESKGTYYRPITARTFYLETSRKGYLPATLSYDEFMKLSIEDQRNILNQPYEDYLNCSVDNPDIDCILIGGKPEKIEVSDKATKIDLSPKCDEKDAKSKTKESAWTTKLLMDPSDKNLQNIDCDDVEETTGETDKTPVQRKSPSTAKVITGVGKK